MDELERKLGYSFKDKELLLTALTHSSYANERSCDSYERLEFLGDSILGCVTAEFLYRHEGKTPEGRMTRLRAELVCESSLHKVASELELGKYLRLGRGEEHTGGRERVSILADIVEAIIAAMYLDSGMEQPRIFIMDRLLKNAEIGEQHRIKDYKTELQEVVQRVSGQRIGYEPVSESGPDHDKTFVFRVTVNGRTVGEGSGKTKKEAEQMAACKALEELRK